MVIKLGKVRINVEYLNNYLASYSEDGARMHIVLTDDARFFSIRNIDDDWKNDYGINSVVVDHQSGTVMIEFTSQENCLKYAEYLDYFLLEH